MIGNGRFPDAPGPVYCAALAVAALGHIAELDAFDLHLVGDLGSLAEPTRAFDVDSR